MDLNEPSVLYYHVLWDLLQIPDFALVPQSMYMGDDPLDESLSPRVAACVSLMRSITKKFPSPSALVKGKEVAIKNFLACNARCGEWKITDDPFHRLVFDLMRLYAYRELGPIDWQQLLATCRVGPGASVGSKGRNSALEKIFVNEFTATDPALYGEYRRFAWNFPTWASAEMSRVQLAGSNVKVVRGSNLTTVPKNDRTDRTICTEPSLNMMFQLSLGDAFLGALKRHYGYDPALQPARNQEMARRGSIDGSLATIDLRSASDTISHKLVSKLLPNDWVAAINDCRSPETQIDGEWCALEMTSSMGNGFTFPMQTYLFSLAIKCLCKALDVPFQRYDKRAPVMGVFGDDIIVPQRMYSSMCSLLNVLGFEVNESKSFNSGPFRESCGADWFKGYDIRGIYCTRLRNNADRFSLINRLNRWSAKHGVLLCGTLEYLLPKGWSRFSVPYYEADTAGVKCSLHRQEPNGLFRYTALEQRTRVLGIYEALRLSERSGRDPKLKPAFDNPNGVLLASSVGWLRSRGVPRKSEDASYYPVQKFAVRYSPTDEELATDGIFRRKDWEDITYWHLPSRYAPGS